MALMLKNLGGYWEIYNSLTPQLLRTTPTTLPVFNFAPWDKASCVQEHAPRWARWGIDSDSVAIKGLKRANLEQIVRKTDEKKKTAIVLVQRAVQVRTNRNKMEDDDRSFLGGPTLVCSSTKTIIPPLNTGSVTQRPRKSFSLRKWR